MRNYIWLRPICGIRIVATSMVPQVLLLLLLHMWQFIFLYAHTDCRYAKKTWREKPKWKAFQWNISSTLCTRVIIEWTLVLLIFVGDPSNWIANKKEKILAVIRKSRKQITTAISTSVLWFQATNKQITHFSYRRTHQLYITVSDDTMVQPLTTVLLITANIESSVHKNIRHWNRPRLSSGFWRRISTGVSFVGPCLVRGMYVQLQAKSTTAEREFLHMYIAKVLASRALIFRFV